MNISKHIFLSVKQDDIRLWPNLLYLPYFHVKKKNSKNIKIWYSVNQGSGGQEWLIFSILCKDRGNTHCNVCENCYCSVCRSLWPMNKKSSFCFWKQTSYCRRDRSLLRPIFNTKLRAKNSNALQIWTRYFFFCLTGRIFTTDIYPQADRQANLILMLYTMIS